MVLQSVAGHRIGEDSSDLERWMRGLEGCPTVTHTVTVKCPSDAHTDEPGTWSVDDVVLGFNRLSIIDIAHSHQPLRWGPEGEPDRYMLVFNGEIYNYLELRAELAAEHGAVFHTDGDGEAIIAAYHHGGADGLRRLRGMFAFALWDTVEHELFCARDPFGIKPLFIASGSGGTANAYRLYAIA